MRLNLKSQPQPPAEFDQKYFSGILVQFTQKTDTIYLCRATPAEFEICLFLPHTGLHLFISEETLVLWAITLLSFVLFFLYIFSHFNI